jgi:electron transfer flavoprotein alpha/beta subunit
MTTTFPSEISRIRYDVILCGRQTVGLGGALVGAAIAEYLQVPLVSDVVHLEIEAGGEGAVTERIIEYGGREVICCPLPAVFAVDTAINRVRYVSVRARRKAQGRAVSQWDNRELGIPPEQVGSAASRVEFLEFSPPRAKETFTPPATLPAADRIGLILTGGVKPRDGGDFVTGSSDDIARQAVKCLAAQGLVQRSDELDVS